MSDAKATMLGRIRRALHGTAPAPNITRDYIQHDERPQPDIRNDLVERLRDYRAQINRVSEDELPAAIATACSTYAIQHLALPADIPALWVPPTVEAKRDAPPLSHAELDACEGVLTGCAFAIAQTGTIMLDGGNLQGRRALSLVPDVHLCVVRAAQVVGLVPEGIVRLALQPTRPITFISGPSATSDIELSRVEGVHGPRTLHIFLVE
jgi:L-lactate dehydrogenase complex protein LldG